MQPPISRHARSCARRGGLHPLVLAALVPLLAAASTGLQAAKVEFERRKPHVNIAVIGHVEHEDPALSLAIAADIEFGRNRPAKGAMFLFADGSVRFFEPVGGVLLEGEQCLVFLLGGTPGDLEPTEQAVALLREDPQQRGVVLVELHLGASFPQPLAFAVAGVIDVNRKTQRHRDPGRNQVFRTHSCPFSMRHPLQVVMIGETGLAAGFAASIKVRRDRLASGRLLLGLPEGSPPLRFEPLFGAALPATETGPESIILLLALEDAPPRPENLAMATVRPHPDVPGCDIWDFTSNIGANGGSGAPLRLLFEAKGRTRFPCGADKAHGR